MAQQPGAEFYLRPSGDLELLDKLIDGAARFYGAIQVTVSMQTSLRQSLVLNPQSCKRLDQVKAHPDYLKFLENLKDLPVLELMAVSFEPAEQTWPQIRYRANKATEPYATILFDEGRDRNQQAQEAAQRYPNAIRAFTQAGLQFSSRRRLLGEDLPQEVKSRLADYDSAVAILTDQTARLGSYLADATKTLQDQWLTKTREQEERIRAQEEEGRKRLERLAAEREAEFARREEELKQRADALDTREHRAVSRENYNKLIDQLTAEYKEGAKAWKVTSGTWYKRFAVHVLAVLGLAGFGAIAGFAMFKMLTVSKDEFHWRLILPFSTGVIAFGTTLIFYIRWANDWFSQHAKREFGNVRLIADSMRSAWIVELLMAWHEQKREGPFPSVLLDRLSRNLFHVEDGDLVEHPVAEATSAAPKALEATGEALKNALETIKGLVNK